MALTREAAEWVEDEARRITQDAIADWGPGRLELADIPSDTWDELVAAILKLTDWVNLQRPAK